MASKINISLRPKWFDVDGEQLKCICTNLTFSDGVTYARLKNIKDHDDWFWYNPETKSRTEPPKNNSK